MCTDSRIQWRDGGRPGPWQGHRLHTDERTFDAAPGFHCGDGGHFASGQALSRTRPDDGNALAPTLAQPVAPAEVEEERDEEEFGSDGSHSGSRWMR
jgi:hypothetical protein